MPGGFVYVVQMEGHAWLKIGRTDLTGSGAVLRRVKGMQTGCPLPLQIVKEYPCDNPTLLEQALHRVLAHQRRHGEWFETTLEDIERVMKRARYNPAMWTQVIEEKRQAQRAHIEAERAKHHEAFVAYQESYEAECARRRDAMNTVVVHDEEERAKHVQADMRAFALARKRRRLGKIVRRVGLFCCGFVLGVVVTLLVIMPC